MIIKFQKGIGIARNSAEISTEPSRLSLRLQQGEDVTLPNGSLDISHDETVLIINEFHPDLSDLPTRSSPANDLDNHSMLDL